MKYSLLLLCLIYFSITNAQKQGNTWYFGSNAGLNFNTTPPTALLDGQLNTLEGCATISDNATGALLFYTDGISVWDRTHNKMPSTILTPLIGDPSSSQSAVVVAKPGSTNLYYVFSIPAELKASFSNPKASLCYSIVDMNLNGGKGDVAVSNVPIMDSSTEKIAAVGNCANDQYWIMGHKWDSDSFYAFKLTSSGLSAPVKTKIGIIHQGNVFGTIGYMKFSANKSKLGLCTYRDLNTMQIFDFNFSTGKLSNPITEKFDFPATNDGIYGCTFSPDASKFYVSSFEQTTSKVFQYNLLAGNATAILASKTIVAQSPELFGAIQNGPDRRMYISKSGSNTLDVIGKPNLLGSAAEYLIDNVNIGNRTCTFGLPAIVENYLTPDIIKLQIPSQVGPIPNKIIICDGIPIDFVQTIKAKYDIKPTGTYTINSDSSVVTFAPAVNTTYTVINFGECGFNDTSTFTITVGSKPDAKFYITPNKPTKDSNPILLSNASIGADNYKWYINDAEVSTTIDYSYSNPTLGKNCYKLIATSLQGCTDTALQCVNIIDTFQTVIYVPNAFTPNNDNTNNEFKIAGKNFSLLNFVIYNRYGNEIFNTTNKNIGWDGYQNGLPCNAGTYFYKIKYLDIAKKPQEIMGDVLLIK
jgi:gliding motility-associated-like protein